MSTAERGGPAAWRALLALAGAATAIVIFVYLVGGAIVWERLHVLRLPANQAVAPLDRNLLLVVGVRALAWPVVLGLVVCGSVYVLVARPAGGRARGALRAALLVAWAAGLAALAAFSTVQKAVFLAAVGILVAAGVAAGAGKRLARGRAAVAAALGMAAVGVVVEAVDIYQLPVRLELAHVVASDGTTRTGFFIGATSDTV